MITLNEVQPFFVSQVEYFLFHFLDMRCPYLYASNISFLLYNWIEWKQDFSNPHFILFDAPSAWEVENKKEKFFFQCIRLPIITKNANYSLPLLLILVHKKLSKKMFCNKMSAIYLFEHLGKAILSKKTNDHLVGVTFPSKSLWNVET